MFLGIKDTLEILARRTEFKFNFLFVYRNTPQGPFTFVNM